MIRSLRNTSTATYRWMMRQVAFSIDVKFRRRVTARQCYGCEWVCEKEKERKKSSLARSLAHSTSEGLPVVPQAKRARAFSRTWLGMRPLPRSASRRSHGGTSSFLSTAVAPLARFADRSAPVSLARRDRNDRARITCHRSIANTACRQDGADPIYVVWHIHHTSNE